MNPLLFTKSWLTILLGLFSATLLLRQLLTTLAAEQGRKYDLVRKPYRHGQEFQLSILIPFLEPNDHPALLQLLHAIHQQEYPASKVTVHLVTGEETASELIPQSLRPNVKVWRHPENQPYPEQAIGWLIERCLAAGGNGMFVFLKPSDIIKKDFFQNIAAKGIDSFAIQGYVALKNPPDSLLSQVLALSNRVFNRISNAGRYHLGMSCRLLDSGWAIKQEVLEMIPYHRGRDLDNLEYTIRLNLENFRVTWAPNVVVYSDSRVSALDHFTLCVGTFFNRLSLVFKYGPALLTRMLMRFDMNHFENLMGTISPPYFMTFLALATLAVLDSKTLIPIFWEPLYWGIVATLTLVLNVMALVVSRCKANDYATMIVFTPLAYVLGLLTAPISLFSYAKQKLAERPVQGGSYRKAKRTRFNEELAGPPDLFDDAHSREIIQGILKKNAPESVHGKHNAVDLPTGRRSQKALSLVKPPVDDLALDLPPYEAALSPEEMPEGVTDERANTPVLRQPHESIKAVPLSNGLNQVSCRLKTLTTYNEAGQESYKLTLEYKTVSFSTESYRILDQAFYELHAKLMSRGLTMVTCGSCGNFYNPTADVPGALKTSGVCLFDKIGKEVNLNTDAVTVISQACDYHCPLDQREGIVRQWKESLTYSRSH